VRVSRRAPIAAGVALTAAVAAAAPGTHISSRLPRAPRLRVLPGLRFPPGPAWPMSPSGRARSMPAACRPVCRLLLAASNSTRVACSMPGQIQARPHPAGLQPPGPVQAKTFGLPARPRFTIVRPAAGPQKALSTERAELRALISR